MTFLNPIGLIGLASLPVILALHLLFRRKKRYVVSDLNLWSFLDADARGPRARRVPLTWLLLLDLLIAALLSLAWSRPNVAIAEPGPQPHHWVILLDVSSSMRAQDGATTRFAEAKSAALALLRQTTFKDRVTIITFGREARIIADTSSGKGQPNSGGAVSGGAISGADGGKSGSLSAQQISLPLLERQINAVRAGETGHALPEALAMGKAALDPTLPAEFHIITDGAFPLPDTAAFEQFAYPLQWHWVGQPGDNQAVVDLNATPLGGGQVQVFARFANFSSQAVTRSAALSIDGKVFDRVSLALPPGSTVPHVWQISPGSLASAGSVEVALSGGDMLPDDDSAVIGAQPGGKIRVALVAENPAPIQQALQAIPDVDLHLFPSAGELSQETAPFDLTIFRGVLPAAWPPGQALVVDPPAAGSQNGASDLAAQIQAGPETDIPPGSFTQAADDSPLIAGIDFSGVRWSRVWTLKQNPDGFTPLIQAGGTPILLQGTWQPAGGLGQVSVLLADLTQGNFARHPAFPILMANLVENARHAPLPAGFKTGEALPLPVQGSYQALQITPPQQPPISLGRSWPERWTDTLDPGLYRFQLTGRDGSQTNFTAGAQAGDLVESDLRQRDWTQSITAADRQANSNPVQQAQILDLRSWLLGAAVLIFMVEALLAWRRF